jgi:hypothetical protein
MFGWFERRLNPYPEAQPSAPPHGLLAFCWHYSRADARSQMTGRIVDSYTNIQTVKLFAHAEREDDYARESFEHGRRTFQKMMRLFTSIEICLVVLNGVLMVTVIGLGSRCGPMARRRSARSPRPRAAAPAERADRLDHVGDVGFLPESRRGARGRRDHRAAARPHRQARRHAAGGDRRRHPLRDRLASITGAEPAGSTGWT